MNLLQTLTSTYPTLTFQNSASFYWSPQDHTVFYNAEQLKTPEGAYKLLHETGHGLLGHQTYATDFELLQLELAAWQKAQQLADSFDMIISQEHIEECLNSYRDWLHMRSTCPSCRTNGLQTNEKTYECLNCSHTWQVSRSRFCRAYRRSK